MIYKPREKASAVKVDNEGAYIASLTRPWLKARGRLAQKENSGVLKSMNTKNVMHAAISFVFIDFNTCRSVGTTIHIKKRVWKRRMSSRKSHRCTVHGKEEILCVRKRSMSSRKSHRCTVQGKGEDGEDVFWTDPRARTVHGEDVFWTDLRAIDVIIAACKPISQKFTVLESIKKQTKINMHLV